MFLALLTIEIVFTLPCIRLARGKFELTNQGSAGGEKSSVLTSSKQVRKGFEIRQLFSLEMALNIHEKRFTFSKTIPVCKKGEKYEPFCVSKLLFRRQKWVAGARHGNPLVVRRVSPGRIIVVVFRTKYAVPRLIKPRTFKLTTSRGQSNLRTVFIFDSCEAKGCYRIVRTPNFLLPLVLRAQPPYARRAGDWKKRVYLIPKYSKPL